jgi:hypothetical protein
MIKKTEDMRKENFLSISFFTENDFTNDRNRMNIYNYSQAGASLYLLVCFFKDADEIIVD